MTRQSPAIALIVALLFARATMGIRAAEIHFRAECRIDGGLVLLGDLAEIYDADAAEVKTLSAIDLLPAPPAKEKRILRAREVQDLLQLRGADPNHHRFTGASQVAVVSSNAVAARPASKPISRLNVPMQQVIADVRQAIVGFLNEKIEGDCEWVVKFDLKPEQAQLLSVAGVSLHVDGGASPWTGLQNLTLSYPTHDGEARVPLSVQVTSPPTVVVAAQLIVRGATIRLSDVRLQAGRPSEGSVYVYRSIDEVVGKEALKPIVEGQILDDHLVRRPMLVQRSEVVTVYARTAGLRVRTTARALEAGGEGDLVRVESMNDRKSYFARITGPQEVEVFAHAPVATSDAPASRIDTHVQQAAHQKRLPPAPMPRDGEGSAKN